jgi:hypothetical protein
VKKTCNIGIWSLGSDAIKPRLNDAPHRFRHLRSALIVVGAVLDFEMKVGD